MFRDQEFIRSQSVVSCVAARDGTGTPIWKLLDSPKAIAQLAGKYRCESHTRGYGCLHGAMGTMVAENASVCSATPDPVTGEPYRSAEYGSGRTDVRRTFVRSLIPGSRQEVQSSAANRATA